MWHHRKLEGEHATHGTKGVLEGRVCAYFIISEESYLSQCGGCQALSPAYHGDAMKLSVWPLSSSSISRSLTCHVSVWGDVWWERVGDCGQARGEMWGQHEMNMGFT